MSHVVIKPGDATMTEVARGLLDVAAALELPADVVDYLPSQGGFRVPEAVAQAYASMQEETGDFGLVELPAVEASEHDGNATETGAEDTGTDGEGQNGQAAAGEGNTAAPKSLAEAQAAEHSGPRRYTDEEKAQAIAAVLEGGKTIAEAADEIGASATSVSKWVTAAKNEGGAV